MAFEGGGEGGQVSDRDILVLHFSKKAEPRAETKAETETNDPGEEEERVKKIRIQIEQTKQTLQEIENHRKNRPALVAVRKMFQMMDAKK
jgi:hypothetical protein